MLIFIYINHYGKLPCKFSKSGPVINELSLEPITNKKSEF